MAQKTERRLSTGRGSWDEGREKWEGEIPAEPKTTAIGEWRLATAASEVVKPKISRFAGTLPSRKTIRHSLLPFATRRSLLATHYSPFATRHSLLAIHYSLFAAVSLAAHFYSFPASPFPAFCFAAMMAASA
jgi:hypothetical protein